MAAARKPIAHRLTPLALCCCLALVAACGPSTPAERMAAARVAISEGDARTAEIHLRNLLRDTPGDATARQLLGELQLAAGDLAGGEQSLRRALELGTPADAVRMPLLGALIGQRKFNEALNMIPALGDIPDRDRETVLIMTGMAHQGLGSDLEAEQAYRAAVELAPESTVARSELAGFLLAHGRGVEAGSLVRSVLQTDPNFGHALLLRGVIEHSEGRFAAAETSFTNAVDSVSSDARTRVKALARLVESQLALGKLAEADASASRVLQLTPLDPLARYLKARVEYRQGKIDAADRRLLSLVADFPNYAVAHTLLGRIRQAKGQSEQAMMYLQSAISNNPGDQTARLLLAETYIKEGELTAAKRLFDDSSALGDMDGVFLASAGRLSLDAGRPELAADYFDESASSNPGSIQELVSVSSIYLAAGEFERAVRLLQEASVSSANSSLVRDYLVALIELRRGALEPARLAAERLVIARPKTAWTLNLLGSIDLLAQDFAAARNSYDSALESDPDNVPALLNLARIAVATSEADVATEHLQRVLEIDPAELTARAGLAQLAAERGDLPAAHALLSEGVESSLLSQMQGELFAAESRYPESYGAFSRAFQLEPSGQLALKIYAVATKAGISQPAAALRAWVEYHPDDVSANFVLGLIAQSQGDSADAVARYEAVLATDPKHFGALNNLAGLYSQSNLERAVEYATRAHAVQPQNPTVADTLGWLHVLSGDAETALPFLEQAVNAMPDSLEVRYHRAVAMAESQDDARPSIAELQELLRSETAFASRSDAVAYLEKLEDGREQ